ncbi:MAG: nitrate reductase, partial [Gammaproteobacteria bacterium]|nr:nitrate reductase [Gammaproteobacteria bacterium]
AFLGLMLLILHRMLNPVTRAISDRGDYIGSLLIFLVMLTGCLALARSHEVLRVTHFFLAELLLIYFPFSALMHTFTFPFSRGFMGAHYGRRGVNV